MQDQVQHSVFTWPSIGTQLNRTRQTQAHAEWNFHASDQNHQTAFKNRPGFTVFVLPFKKLWLPC